GAVGSDSESGRRAVRKVPARGGEWNTICQRSLPGIIFRVLEGGNHGRIATGTDRRGADLSGGPAGNVAERGARRGAPDAHGHLPRARGPQREPDRRTPDQARSAAQVAGGTRRPASRFGLGAGVRTESGARV